MTQEVTLTRTGRVAELTISRPSARNAMNYSMLEELDKHLDTLLEELPGVLVIRATDPGFCAGIDLKEAGESTSDFVRRRVRLMHRGLNKIRTFPAPVLGAINGVAAGLGCELAISADLRIATPETRFSYPEPHVAVPSPTHHLVWLIGLAKAQDMLLTARWIHAEEAAQIGLATQVTDDLDATVNQVADRLLSLAPLATRRTKENLNILMHQGMDAAFEHMVESVIEAAGTDDRREALQAFAEKRKPEFTGG